LIEHNLAPVFNCRLVATEFPTGARPAGRIDTLALFVSFRNLIELAAFAHFELNMSSSFSAAREAFDTLA
jgi:hypothetical protein